MAYEKKIVPADELQIGMCVSELDRPWEGTPFPLQGFCIKDNREIDALKKLCNYVYVERRNQEIHKSHDRSTGALKQNPGDVTLNERLPLPERQVEYKDKLTVEEELKAAEQNYENLSGRFRNIFAPFKSSKNLKLDELEKPISGMVDSIIRNPNAYMRLTILKERDDYTYNHCINMGILAVAFGRHLGMTKEDLNMLAWGAVFCDFGKAMLPTELLNKAGHLSEAEFNKVKRHVEFSVDAVKSIEDISGGVVEIIQCHHERFNGTGFPKGLIGKQIPLFSRMVSIVDSYDAMINDRPYARAISPHEAIRELYELRDVAYQAELVEAFIQSIGVYPVGTLVELNTGQVGVVISQNAVRHLKPKIMLILDENKVAYKISPILDLLKESRGKDNKQVVITNVLEPNSYGIRTEQVNAGR